MVLWTVLDAVRRCASVKDVAKRQTEVSPIEPGDLTFAVVADHLGVHPETIGRMARTGLIPARRVPGKGCHGTKRIRRLDLAAAIDGWTVHAERTTA